MKSTLSVETATQLAVFLENRLLGETGTLALESEVLMIEGTNQSGSLRRIAERLAKASVNIEYAYLAASPKAEKGLMILRPSDIEKARRALKDL